MDNSSTALTPSRFEIYGKDEKAITQILGSTSINDKGLTSLKKIDVGNIEISHGVIQGYEFTLGDFDGSRIVDLTMELCELEGTSFSEVSFINCKFVNLLMYVVTTYGASFKNCSFKDTKFLGCNLSATDFVDCKFANVYFGSDNTGFQTQLSETNFSKSEFEDMQFSGAEYDRDTKFPARFNPALFDGLSEQAP